MGYSIGNKIYYDTREKTMQNGKLIDALKCIGGEIINELPDIMEPFPYGKAVGTLIKAIKEGIHKYSSLEVKRMTNDAKKEIKDTLRNTETPRYMSNILYTCKAEYYLSEEQKENLALILQMDFPSDDVNSLAVISEFIEVYMGGSVDVDNEDECSIGNDYIYFNFTIDYDEDFEYNKEDIDLVMNALNNLLGAEVFDYGVAGGY